MILEEKNALAMVQAKIPGIKKAYAQGPTSIPEDNLPLFINFSGASTERSLDADLQLGYTERQYLARLYVGPVTQGISGELEEQAEGLLDASLLALRKYPHLQDESGSPLEVMNLQRCSVIGDSGLVVLQYASTSYLGAEIRLLARSLFVTTVEDHN